MNLLAQLAGGAALAGDTANKPKPKHKKTSLIIICSSLKNCSNAANSYLKSAGTAMKGVC
jgi:hypothetical protein